MRIQVSVAIRECGCTADEGEEDRPCEPDDEGRLGIRKKIKGIPINQDGYANNVRKGTAKAVLIGKGRFAGRKTVSFKIKEKKGSYQGSLVGREWK